MFAPFNESFIIFLARDYVVSLNGGQNSALFAKSCQLAFHTLYMYVIFSSTNKSSVFVSFSRVL